jgi:hypothetical protein
MFAKLFVANFFAKMKILPQGLISAQKTLLVFPFGQA